jgi:2-polyprenyl-3-methyl-5-hydroxy-6-metoxy-1,4-benzoquinol methylase
VSEEKQQGEPTGERFIPELMGGGLLEAEHQTRYRFSLQSIVGKRVLDAGCGVGWGAALMLDAGAESVVGVDISSEAIADARGRSPDATFATGDLLALPFDSHSFDVAVCFEAIEHTGDTARTLDELARVLRPDGILFVSSPNPEVYPSGNPFHLNEETPERLLAAVRARFANAILFHQYLQIASVLGPDGLDPWTQRLDLAVWSVGPLAGEHNPYSVVVASNAELSQLQAHAMLASSDQLDNITTLSDSLEKERVELHDRMSGEAERITAEWERLSSEWERISEESERVGDLEQRIEALTLENRELERQRDTYGVRSLNAEQERAQMEQERAQMEQMRAQMEQTLHTVINSKSWRATESLRRVAREIRRLRP